MSCMDVNRELELYLNTPHPILYYHSNEFIEIDNLIKSVCSEYKIIEFNHAFGAVDFFNKSYSQTASAYKCTLDCFLENNWDNGFDNKTILLLKDIHNDISSPITISLLKRIAEARAKHLEYRLTVIIVSSRKVIPIELNSYVSLLSYPLPSDNEIESRIIEHFKVNEIEQDTKKIAKLMLGLTLYQVDRVLSVLTYEDLINDFQAFERCVSTEKEQSVKKTELLEIIRVNESIDDIGGLKELKKWLLNKSKIIRDLDSALNAGLDKPKGIMITGLPGCGKSLTAKATAKIFEFPLLKFDIGKVLGKYVGESEENMHVALKLAEAMSPCVLWIDEIEKAFTGIGGNEGGNSVTTRIFGQFLTWMQENKSTVFIVATANDISNIPLEFMRKGRFDEVFFVDIPDDKERKKIFKIQFRKRLNEKMNTDLKDVLTKKMKRLVTDKIINRTDGFISSEIETAVKMTFELAYLNNMDLDEDLLLEAIEDVKPISVTQKDKFAKIRKKSTSMDLKNASKVRFSSNYDDEEDEDDEMLKVDR